MILWFYDCTMLKPGAQRNIGTGSEDHQPGSGRFFISLLMLYMLQQIICPSQASATAAQEWGAWKSKQQENETIWHYICHFFFPQGSQKLQKEATKPLRISSKYTFLWCFLAFAEHNLGPAVGNFKLPALVSAMLLYPDRSHQDGSVPAFSWLLLVILLYLMSAICIPQNIDRSFFVITF